MKLAQLLSVFPQLKWGAKQNHAEEEVLGITPDSRKAREGMVFVAIRGTTADGHGFLEQVAQQNPLALIVEDDAQIPRDYQGAVAKVANTRRALEQLAQKFYAQPAKDLFCVGVTGTNGKTTITYMVEKILNQFGWPTGVIGTIDHHLGSHKWGSQLTTPDPLTLQERLRQFVDHGARAAAFEVSSHALHQDRARSMPFNVGVFTNFTRDHLDYHKTMEEYFAAKEILFKDLLGKERQPAFAILNGDDPWIRKTQVRDGVTTWWFGKQNADFEFKITKQDLNGSEFHLRTPRGEENFHLPTTGEHNVYNAVAAIAAGVAAGASLATCKQALASFNGAPGRLEKVNNEKNLHIFVDYAHTDDAVRTVVKALDDLRGPARKSRILTVFGCGGDRDKGKRPLMARAAAEKSDVVIITSDNPRTEDPLQIIADIKKGIPEGWRGQLIIEPDRKKALAESLQTAREGDVILVAGKGHEDYQIIGDKKLPFSDQEVLRELLDQRRR